MNINFLINRYQQYRFYKLQNILLSLTIVMSSSISMSSDKLIVNFKAVPTFLSVSLLFYLQDI